MTKPEDLKQEINRQRAEIDVMLNDAVFIGIFNLSQKHLFQRMAQSNGLESAVHAKAVISKQLETLKGEFDQLAKDDDLEDLRRGNPDRFRILWKAKFMKEPAVS